MFLHLSVILSTEGVSVQGGSLSGGSLSGGVSVPGSLSIGISIWGVSLSRGVSVQGDPQATTIRLRAGSTNPTGMHSCLLG